MPTLAVAAVERVRSGLAHVVAGHGPGQVVGYADLARLLAKELPSGSKRFHLLRAALEQLRSEGAVELWGRSLRDGRWVVVWVRLPGRAPLPTPPVRKKWQSPTPRVGRFRVAPELRQAAEQAILTILRGPHDERELTLAAAFKPAPGPGWVAYAYVTARVGHLVQLSPATRLNVIGTATRELARRHKVELLVTPMKHGGTRVRWLRLANSTAEAVSSTRTPSPLPPRCHPEPSR